MTALGPDKVAGSDGRPAAHGQGLWNGVAILSRVGLDDVVAGLDGAPDREGPEARAVVAMCGGVRVHSLYVPNGRRPDSEHYRYTLAWLAVLRDVVAAGPADAIALGDMNIAPADDDVFDPDACIGQTHVTPPERAAFGAVLSLGLLDVVRERWPSERIFTYGDSRVGMFHQDRSRHADRQRPERPRPRDGRPGRGPRRRHRPAGASPSAKVVDEILDGRRAK